MNPKDLKRWLLFLFVFTVAGSLMLWQFSSAAGIVFLLSALIWNLCFALYLLVLDKRIRSLSRQLMNVYSNAHAIDIRDQQEGSFSILKNDIYKIVRTFYEQKEELGKERTFLSNLLDDVSHQLKTPLTSMQMMSELLAQKLPDEKRREFSTILQNQLTRLQWLVTSLLKLSRLDACTIHFEKQTFCLEDLLLDALEPITAVIQKKKLNIEMSGCSIDMTADFNWTKEALLNVLKNAAEHTAENGTIKISAQTTKLFTILQIADNGEGMSLKDQAHIFERFYRGQNAGSDSIGIGMAMTKAILNAQNAEISVQSSLHRGTRFTIQFQASDH